ncbi:HigA family addiction module antitoxin [Nocardia sp. NPDC058176]|uniref:HigA family addiction module antitoxin n=1 Tax=Nocardia sp. NPDC058176 TaxID=3346368 RepID=UPI0036DD58D6
MNENTGLPAQAFPAGEYLRDELEAREWSVVEFARILGRPPQAVSEILNGRKEITPETAMEIAAATDTEAATWLRLQDTYRLWKLSRTADASRTAVVARRARLAQLLPMSELRKRSLIPPGADIDTEEAAVLDLLEISDFSEQPPFVFAARRSNESDPVSPPQLAWIASVRKAATAAGSLVPRSGAIPDLAADVVSLSRNPEALTRLPEVFAAYGIRLVYVAHFKSGKIDGGAYIDDMGTPVVAISGRVPRIDSVVFTLLHELAHIHLGHLSAGMTLDTDVCAATENATEREADRLAMRWALPPQLGLEPPISKRAVLDRASTLGVHPGLIVGRLQHKNILPWTHLRDLTPNVRNQLAAWG